MGQPHKHAALIKAWADGAEIQVKDIYGLWTDMDVPRWMTDMQYRIKPVPKVKKYRYVYKLANNSPCLTTAHYESNVELENDMRNNKLTLEWCQRIDQTLIEI